MSEELARSFWKKVHKTDVCWFWVAGKYSDGYGQFRNKRAHRVVFSLTFGNIPAGKLICHRCDNPTCVRPDHLFIGTAKENTQDAIRKGRMVPGETFLGKKHTKESKLKMSISNHLRKDPSKIVGDKNPMYGKTMSDQAKKKLSEALSGSKAPWFGKHLPEDMKLHISSSVKKLPKVTCETCLKIVSIPNYVRWHGSNCKLKKG